jgi:hypothetical protein
MMVGRDRPRLYGIEEIPWTQIRRAPLGGCEARTISQDRRTGSKSLMVRIPRGWHGAWTETSLATEWFVLSGGMSINGDRATSGCFASTPPGSSAVELTSQSGCMALCFQQPSARKDGGIAIRNMWQQPWHESTLAGVPAGLLSKSLRRPDPVRVVHGTRFTGGIEGFLRLVSLAPGWFTAQQERHSKCWEENIMLRGDLMMVGRGVMEPGSCLAHPAGTAHGPMVTKGGALMIVHCDAPMDVTWSPVENGEQEIARYLEAAPWA